MRVGQTPIAFSRSSAPVNRVVIANGHVVTANDRVVMPNGHVVITNSHVVVTNGCIEALKALLITAKHRERSAADASEAALPWV